MISTKICYLLTICPQTNLKEMRHLRLISKLFLQVYTKVAFLIRLHFMVELVYASFTD